jgi:pimeloyl-ACP methyl ester carboxylesterase
MSIIHFVHGKESGPWGTKITYLSEIVRRLGLTAESLDYSDLPDPMDRAMRLVAHCEKSPPALLVGSSMGGWVATAASTVIPVKAVLLMAPAFYIPGYKEIGLGNGLIEIVHGWKDDVVPCENSIRFAREWDCTLHLVDDDHGLTHRLDLIGEYLSALIKRVL